MAKTRSTKRALLLSALSLLMCVSMLIGSTFAWFTDEVTSSGNQIVSGKLDVDLIDANGVSLENETLQFVDKDGKEILTQILWEPGCTYTLEPVRVKNNGNLWLKYEIVISGIEGDAKLLEAIEWTIMLGDNEVTLNDLKGYLEPEKTSEALQIIGHMKEEAGNEYQNLTIDGISITVYATQVNAESDSFGPDYDKDAVYADYYVTDNASLQNAIDQAKDGEEIALMNNIDLGGATTFSMRAVAAGKNFEFVVPAGKNVVLNLNGYNITRVSANSDINGDGAFASADNQGVFQVKGSLTVVGEGVISMQNTGDNMGWNALTAVFSVEGGNLTLGKDVTVVHRGGSDMAFAVDVNTSLGHTSLTVDGATLTSTYTGVRLFNFNATNKATVNVNSGKISGDKRDIWRQSTGANEIKIADDIAYTEADGIYSLEGTTVGTNAGLKKALEAGEKDIELVAGNYTFPSASLTADTTLNCAPGTVFEGTSKLNIKGATVVGATFSNPTGTAADQTINGKFVDCVFEGQNGLRWCYSGDTVEFENCVFSGSTYGVHFDGGAKKVTFKDCTISGFNATAGSIENITFDACTFVGNGKSAYNGINLWGNGDFKDCTFVFDGSTENEWIDLCGAEKTATFTNCVVTDGTTTKDIAEVVSKRNDNATIIVNGSVVAHSVANLDDALASGKNAVLIEDMRFSSSDTKANSGYGATGVSVKGGVLDGNGHKLGINNWGTWDAAVHTTGGTIKNLTINSGMRGIFMGSATADVKIDNVTIDGTIYTFNSDGGNKNYGVYISNSTLNGWTSHSDVHKEVVYTNCSFGEGQGYAFCRPYGPTQFIGCDFAAGFQVDAVGAVTFENCTIGGVALTAENLSTLVTGGIANATVK